MASSRFPSSSSSSAPALAPAPPPPPPPYPGDCVLVAVNAGKGVSPHALEWALGNVVQAGDHITLIALLPAAGKNGARIWRFPKLTGDCGSRATGRGGNAREMEEEATDSCSSMMQKLHNLCYHKKVKVNVRVVVGVMKGAIAMEAQKAKASWVILDSHLPKDEAKSCMQGMQCNLVTVKRNGSDAKVQRLNLRGAAGNAGGVNHSSKGKKVLPDLPATMSSSSSSTATTTAATTAAENAAIAAMEKDSLQRELMSLPHDTLRGSRGLASLERPASWGSPGARTAFTATEKGTSSSTTESSSEPFRSPLTSAEEGKSCLDRDRDVHGSSVIETDSAASDHGPSDSCGETSSDGDADLVAPRRRRPVLSRTAHASPEQQRTKICNVRHLRLDGSLTTAASRHESHSWMRGTNMISNSANVTPQVVRVHQRCTSTPASPLSSSKRFGPPRPSSRLHQHGSLGTEGQKGSHERQQPHHRHLQQSFNMRPDFDLGKIKTAQDLLDKYLTWEHDAAVIRDSMAFMDLDRTSSVRKAVFLSKNVPPGPPPLCSICQHKAPVFGKPPRRFTYGELELATGGFSQANFLAEGGFGCVHRGVLTDGQAVAVKQHKVASAQGDIEFCSEVEVLSCAQHRNVVMLIGYCIEDKRRLLVYEFICNGSLDLHLYGKNKGCLEWAARQKIAIGAARGLRYLHEECRVGCIVHRDMRPNNILLTHDFEPMVGDFGLARWQPNGDLGVQTRVIGTFGYLAPEYAQSGQITEKADVYSFGVVLVELVTGRKAVDLDRPKGEQCLTEWARPLLDEHATEDLVDPLLRGNYSDYEVYCMLHAASLCLQKDPHLRPRMSQVLRVLEGDVVIATSESSTPCSHGSGKVRRSNLGRGGFN